MKELLAKQRKYFASGVTASLEARQSALQKLEIGINKYEKEFTKANEKT